MDHVAKNLRTFLEQLAEARPDDLKVVEREVDPVFEIAALIEKLQKRNQLPGWLGFGIHPPSLAAERHGQDRIGRVWLVRGTLDQQPV